MLVIRGKSRQYLFSGHAFQTGGRAAPIEFLVSNRTGRISIAMVVTICIINGLQTSGTLQLHSSLEH